MRRTILQVFALLLGLLVLASADEFPFQNEFDLVAAVDAYMANPSQKARTEEIYGEIQDWDVSQVENFSNLFNTQRNSQAKDFNADLSRWDVGNARYMHDMFLGAEKIDFDVTNWQVGKVGQFNGMFLGAKSFTGKGLRKWNVSSGSLFQAMFANTTSLRGDLDLSQWNVRSARSMNGMFQYSTYGSTTSQQNLCNWVSQLDPSVNTRGMFVGSACPEKGHPTLAPPAQETDFCTICSLDHASNSNNPAQGRPNILFLMTDQQRFDSIRRVQEEITEYKNVTKIRTPNLDKLSRGGTMFRNAYCQCAVCAPARTTIRTGCTIERTGVQHNELAYEHEWSKSDLFTRRIEALKGIDQVLAEEGYTSEHYGKWHMPNTLYKQADGSPAVQYNDYSYADKSFSFRGDSTGRKTRRYLNHFEDLGEIARKLESGQQHDTFTGFPYRPNKMDVRVNSPTGTPLTVESGFEMGKTTQSNVVGAFGLSEKYTPSHFTYDVSLKALERLMEETDPWFLTVSFHNPHPPMVAASKYLDYYWGRRKSLFVSPSIDDPMDNSDYGQASRGDPKYKDPESVQEWTATYYALIEEIDDYVGLLLDTLGDTRNNTLIVFTSDHGEMLGAHGKREKNNFYEEASRVPLFLAFDGVIKPGQVIDDMVSHLDLFSTILDYSGSTGVDDSDGTSLRPLVEQLSFNEDYDENIAVGEWDFRKVLPCDNSLLERPIDERPSLMIRKGDWKLMTHKSSVSTKIDMMFNLKTDPYELNNVLGKNAETAALSTLRTAEHLRCLLLDWMERMDGDEGYFSDPENNYGEGMGDILEIKNRQSWPSIGFWMSHMNEEGLIFGAPAWIDSRLAYTRNEYIYFGTRTPADVLVEKISIEGVDASFFEIDRTQLRIEQFECQRIQVQYAGETRQSQVDAAVRVTRKGEEDIVIPISLQQSFGREKLATSSPVMLPTAPPSEVSSTTPTLNSVSENPSVVPSTTPTLNKASDEPSLAPSTPPTLSRTNVPSVMPTLLSEKPSSTPTGKTDEPSTFPEPSVAPTSLNEASDKPTIDPESMPTSLEENDEGEPSSSMPSLEATPSNGLNPVVLPNTTLPIINDDNEKEEEELRESILPWDSGFPKISHTSAEDGGFYGLSYTSEEAEEEWEATNKGRIP